MFVQHFGYVLIILQRITTFLDSSSSSQKLCSFSFIVCVTFSLPLTDITKRRSARMQFNLTVK